MCAVNQAFSPYAYNDGHLLALLGAQKALVEEQISNTKKDLRQLRLCFGSEAELEVFSNLFSSVIPSEVRQEQILVSNPSCSLCGKQIGSFPEVSGWCAASSLLCTTCACLQSWASDPRVGTRVFLEVVLEQAIETSRALAWAEGLLSAIYRAHRIVKSRLLSGSFIRHGIAVCQRRFFTHHGTHPPEHGAFVCSGLFLERVFQLPAR